MGITAHPAFLSRDGVAAAQPGTSLSGLPVRL
jgi:hypothetical protein